MVCVQVAVVVVAVVAVVVAVVVVACTCMMWHSEAFRGSPSPRGVPAGGFVGPRVCLVCVLGVCVSHGVRGCGAGPGLRCPFH